VNTKSRLSFFQKQTQTHKHTYDREHATRTSLSSYRLLKTAITITFALFCWIPYLNYLPPQAKRYRRENRKHSTGRERERERERERREESTALGGGGAAEATAAPNPDLAAKSDEQRAPAPAAIEAVSLRL
jgi:hypothetical protein